MGLLQGIGVSGFRSFGYDDVEYVGPMGKVNLLAGQNNAGKSNLLRFVDRVFPHADHSPRPGELSALDRPAWPSESVSREPRLSLAVAPASVAEALEAAVDRNGRVSTSEVERLKGFFSGQAFRKTPDDLTWLQYVYRPGISPSLQLDPDWLVGVARADDYPEREMGNASSALTGTGGGGVGEDLRRVLSAFDAAGALPPVQTVDAFRRIADAKPGSNGSYSGEGLIDRLARLSSPSAEEGGDEAKFASIQDFVRTVLEDDGVELRIPYLRDTINVRRNGALLPLEHLGTGIHEVVILAAAATLLTGHLVCIEEPEIHLHPLLQRKLLRYLAEQTSNQYLIATHSAHMLDADLSAIFHVSLGPTGTQIASAITPRGRAQICADLGYRPSDLVQANAVLWVEGPSDRIYLQKWISEVDATLLEGLHYSIMFYGGRLLNHLSADDPDVRDFISLRRMNRHVAILIDSDKRSAAARINATKQRVKGELEDGFAWITKGYTIENYVPHAVLSAAVGAVHPRAVVSAAGVYENPLGVEAVVGVSSPDKTAIARQVVSRWTSETDWPLDLKRQVHGLVAFIRAANGLAGGQ